jgi:ribosomal protein L24E
MIHMNIEDFIGYQEHIPTCVVCGKNVTGGGGFARINQKGTMVNLCCPGCMDTFAKDPEPHMARLRKMLEYRALRDISKPVMRQS